MVDVSVEKQMLYDKDIREPLFEFLEIQYGKCRIIEEKQIGRSRADVVMVLSDAVVGIEIKSDADTYARLKRQVRDYNQYFDYNYVVVGSTHAIHVAEHVPKWWGILSVETEGETVDFYMVRQAAPNPKRNADKKLSLLWKSELFHIQMQCGMPKYRQKSKAFVRGKILETIPEETLWKMVSEELFERDYNEEERDY